MGLADKLSAFEVYSESPAKMKRVHRLRIALFTGLTAFV